MIHRFSFLLKNFYYIYSLYMVLFYKTFKNYFKRFLNFYLYICVCVYVGICHCM